MKEIFVNGILYFIDTARNLWSIDLKQELVNSYIFLTPAEQRQVEEQLAK